MSLRIPTSEYDKLVRLAKLDDDSVNSLRNALQTCAPQFSPKSLVKSLQEKTGIGESIIGDIVGLLMNLYWVREENESESASVAHDLVEAARTIKDIRSKLPLDDELNNLEQRLTSLLSIDGCLAVTTKARYVASRSERTFSSSKIFTDARPIYSRDPGNPPDAFVITQLLQIDAFEDGKEKSWFVLLDCEDLGSLKSAIDRAIEKETSLRKVLEQTKILTLREVSDAS